MKEIRLYTKSALQEAYSAGVTFAEGNPDLWRKTFEAGERRGANFFNEAANAPNWIQYMEKERETRGQKFKDWLRINQERLSTVVNQGLYEIATTKTDMRITFGKKLITSEAIEEAVRDVFNISIDDLRFNSRRLAKIKTPRYYCYYLGYFHNHLGLKEMGARWGNKDHATCLHGAKVIARDASTYTKYREKLILLYRHLSQNKYNIKYFVQDDTQPCRVGVLRTLVQPVDLDL
ncbi:MAG TPA: hypothetical protein ENH85_02305 [Candidatus Scalindua sp.]|nr:hypothetical protein [Candidatus Scalindua sp.]